MAKAAASYPVSVRCRVLQRNRASYYCGQVRQTAPPAVRSQRQQQLTVASVTRFGTAHERVGRRPMRQVLAQDGSACSPGLVHRIMTEPGLLARRRRARKRTTRPAPLSNRCLRADGQRSFHRKQPGTSTVGDIPALPTREGWRDLAVVLDLATRAVIGWALRPTLHSEVVSAAVTIAHPHGHFQPAAIGPSDRGTQDPRAAVQAQGAGRGVTPSMGATGVCGDHAVAESFFATLKRDLGAEVGTFATRQDARPWVLRSIEGGYNRRRPHRCNHGRPPLIAWHQPIVQNAVSLS